MSQEGKERRCVLVAAQRIKKNHSDPKQKPELLDLVGP